MAAAPNSIVPENRSNLKCEPLRDSNAWRRASLTGRCVARDDACNRVAISLRLADGGAVVNGKPVDGCDGGGVKKVLVPSTTVGVGGL